MILAEIKSRLVAAHRAKNWEAAKRLSQMKEKHKRWFAKCEQCDTTIKAGAKRCTFHENRRRHYMKIPATVSLLLLCLNTFAGPITFAWDHPDVGTTNAPSGYVLYANTNVINWTTPLARVDTGTNRVATLDSIDTGRWIIWATAYVRSTNVVDGTNSVTVLESDASPSLTLVVPKAPTNTATLAVQWIATLASTNWTDMGYFRLRLGLP